MVFMTKHAEPLPRSQKAFVKAFVELMQEMNFDDIRTSEILSRSGYSRASFYSNYTDKYNLAQSIMEAERHVYVAFSVSYSEAVAANASEKEKIEVIAAYMRHIYENRDIYDIMLLRRIPSPPPEDTVKKNQELVQKYIGRTCARSDPYFDPEFYDFVQMYNSFIYIDYWRIHNYSFTPEEMARKIYASLKYQPYKFDASKK